MPNEKLIGVVITQSKSESFRRLNAHFLAPRPDGPVKPQLLERTNNRLRQKTGQKLNKTELAFQDYLWSRYDPKEIRAQSVTLVLGNGVRYTIDFTNLKRGLAWETKGHMRDDAAVKLKVAATLYPEITFHLVTRQKLSQGGGWDIQEMVP